MMQINKKILNYNDATISYYTFGTNKKGVITFLHPAFGDSNIFVKQIEYFKNDYFLICIDMIGHGQSVQNKPNVNMGNMPEVINIILEQERITKTHIIGVSMGSLVAQSFAYYYSEKVATVTVVGGYSIHKNNEKIIKEQSKHIIKWLFLLLFSIKQLRKNIVQQSSYSEDCRKAMESGANHFTRKSFMAMNGQNKLFITNKNPVSYPLLLVVGEHDLQLAIDHAKDLVQIEPNSRMELVCNSGHCANIDNSILFNQILERFINEQTNG